MKVPAHTSKVGYYVQTRSHTYFWGPRSQNFGSLSQKVVRQPNIAYSNRAPLSKGDRLHCTDYYRKIGRIDSLVSPRVTTSSHRYEAESSIGYRGVDINGFPHGSAYSSVETTVPQWMTDKVIQGCINELNDVRALILEDFADVSKTVTMGSAIFSTIVKLFLLARRGKWRKVRRMLRAAGHQPLRRAANGWLMFFYGIKPLIGSIRAVLSTYGPKELLATAKRKFSWPVDPMGFVLPGSKVTPCGNGMAEQRVKCGLTVSISQDSSVTAWNALGLLDDPTDAVVLAWAIAPYSFVLDWLLPVERFLSSRRWNTGIAYQTGFVTRSLVCDSEYVEMDPMTGTGDYGAMPRVRVRCLQMTRSAYNTFTPPNGLTLNWAINPTNLVSAAALIYQRS